MPPSDPDRLLRLLPNLTPAQRADIVARCNALGTSGDAQRDSCAQMVYGVLVSILGDRGTSCPPPRVFQTMRAGAGFPAKAEVLLDYVRTFMLATKRVEQRAVVRLLVLVLIRRMTRDHVPVTLGTVVRNIPRIPAVTDEQFPGYREAGLLPALPRVLRRAGIK